MNGINKRYYGSDSEDYELLEESADSGFTFTELLISCAITVVLAAVAVPVFTKVLDNVKDQADQSTAAAVQTAYDTAKLMESTPISITADTPEAAFAELVSALQDREYLKNSDYTAQRTGNSFGFNSSTGIVAVSYAQDSGSGTP